MAMAAIGVVAAEAPHPFCLWMNIPVGPHRGIAWLPPVARAGDRVGLHAKMDCVIAMSPCPQAMVKLNGDDKTQVEIEFKFRA